jgi:hypothetical protein
MRTAGTRRLGRRDARWMACHADPALRLLGQKILWTIQNCPWREYRTDRILACLREAEEILEKENVSAA